MAQQKKNDVTVHATAWQDSALPHPLRFAPPYADLATDPKGFSYFWQLAAFVFDLPDPNRFPPLGTVIPADDRRLVDRFISSARELAGYSLMSASGSVTVTVSKGEESWHSDLPSNESVRGAAALFRQLYGTDQGAYKSVAAIISKQHKATEDDNTSLREEILVPWRKAHGKLMQQTIQAMAGRKAANLYAGTSDRNPIPFEDLRPTEIISRYFNGELLHWESRGHELESMRRRDPLMADLDQLHFLEAMAGLCHYYMGFSIIAARAIG